MTPTCAVTPSRLAGPCRTGRRGRALPRVTRAPPCPDRLWFLQRGSRWGSSTSGGSVTWEPARNAASQAPPRPLTQPLGGWCLRGPPGDRRTRRAVCDGLCARGKPPGAALRCHLRRFSQGAPFGGGRWLDGQAPRRRPRRSSWLSSGGVPALPSSASRRETPQARPTRVGLRDTSHNTLCPKDPDPVGPGGACASAAKALQVLLQPDREATVTGNSVCVCTRVRGVVIARREPLI